MGQDNSFLFITENIGFDVAKKLTVDQIKKRLPSHITLDESTYINTKAKTRFIDSEYGEFWTRASSVLKGSNHPKRGKLNSARTQTFSVEQIKNRLPEHIQVDESKYKNTMTKTRFIDKDYGEFYAVPSNVFNGTNHKLRSYDKNKLSINDLKKRLLQA